MEIYPGFILLLIGNIAAIRAQSQDGFISLDCRLLPTDTTYNGTSTNLTYTSDADFVDSGESRKINQKYASDRLRQLHFLRSFPEGKRNCYNLNVTKGTRYLIIASSLYGDYDDLNVLPSFDLFIGPNKWMSVEIKAADQNGGGMLIHVATSDHLQLCLVKTGATTPFLSALELRPLNSSNYATQSGSLLTILRQYLANVRGDYVRFGEDVHDRIWYSYFKDDWKQISTTLDVDTSNDYNLPNRAMKTAATPKNASKPLVISWDVDSNTTQVYMYLHFAEIETLEANKTREFNIFFNGKDWYQKPFSPQNLSVNTLYTIYPETCPTGTCILELIRTPGSTLPPLLNAFEIYTVREFPQSETEQSEVEAVENIKTVYELNRVNWQGDPCAPREFLWDGFNCSYKGNEPPRITSLNLSFSKLMGMIAPYIQNLTQLQELDLSNNSLKGEVPDFLANMKALSVINLSGNNLNGSVPQGLLDREKAGFLKLNVEGNPSLCYPSDACKNRDVRKKAKPNRYLIAIAVLVVIIVVLTIGFVFALKKRTIQAPSANTTKNRWFPYSEVLRLTNNFERILGQGAFGVVYYGRLNDTEQVAVKMLSRPSAHGYKQFKAEVELLLRVHHKNLVSLVGYCDEGDKFALIYEYMANGDLDEHLSGKRESGVLSWASRLKILAEAAQGLDYLHNGCKPPIVHRDVKTANILLDQRFQAKLADFGLSRTFAAENETQTSTVVAGTLGYLDPECYRTNRLTEKSDVYSFGVVLLKMLTNRPVIDNMCAKPHISEWVHVMLTQGNIENIVDPNLQIGTDTNSLWGAVEVAMACVKPSSSERPTMGYVVKALDELLAAENARMHGSQDIGPSMTIDMNLTLLDENTPAAR